MVRVLAVVLSLQMIVAGVARAIDLHDSVACGETAVEAPAGTDGHEAPGTSHPGNCCFGSLLLGSPVAAPEPLPLISTHAAPTPRDSLAVSWHSEAPERPPRS